MRSPLCSPLRQSLQVSTVVQFRNIDYAMERCVLTIVLPERNGTFDPNVKLADPSVVDVWLLDGPTEFSRYIRGSMDYAPKRRELLTTLTFSRSGPSRSNEFHCTSGEFTTLELTCSPTNAGCSVDFWQDQRAKPLGGPYEELFCVQRNGADVCFSRFVYRSVPHSASIGDARMMKDGLRILSVCRRIFWVLVRTVYTCCTVHVDTSGCLPIMVCIRRSGRIYHITLVLPCNSDDAATSRQVRPA